MVSKLHVNLAEFIHCHAGRRLWHAFKLLHFPILNSQYEWWLKLLRHLSAVTHTAWFLIHTRDPTLFHLQAYFSKLNTKSQNSKLLQVETESSWMYGWILCYRKICYKSVRLSLAVYHFYQNAIIPQSQSPFSYHQSSSRFHPLMTAGSLCWVVFVALSNFLSCFVFWDHRKEPSSSHFTCRFSAAFSALRCPAYVFLMLFMRLVCRMLMCHSACSTSAREKFVLFLFMLPFSWRILLTWPLTSMEKVTRVSEMRIYF